MKTNVHLMGVCFFKLLLFTNLHKIFIEFYYNFLYLLISKGNYSMKANQKNKKGSKTSKKNNNLVSGVVK